MRSQIPDQFWICPKVIVLQGQDPEEENPCSWEQKLEAWLDFSWVLSRLYPYGTHERAASATGSKPRSEDPTDLGRVASSSR